MRLNERLELDTSGRYEWDASEGAYYDNQTDLFIYHCDECELTAATRTESGGWRFCATCVE